MKATLEMLEDVYNKDSVVQDPALLSEPEHLRQFHLKNDSAGVC
jgi:hypothetical protein